jgi:hypothetical protein
MTQWKNEYPTLAMVDEASFNTISEWITNLPKPQTDAQRTVHRHLHKVAWKFAYKEAAGNPAAKEMLDKLDGLLDQLAQITGIERR